MISFKLPISANTSNTFRQWAAEIRKARIVNSDDLKQKTWEPSPRGFFSNFVLSDVNMPTKIYYQVDKLVWFALVVVCTTSGTDSYVYEFDLPVQPAAVSMYMPLTVGFIQGASDHIAGHAFINFGTLDEDRTGLVYTYDNSDVGLGANKGFSCSGIYVAE